MIKLEFAMWPTFRRMFSTTINMSKALRCSHLSLEKHVMLVTPPAKRKSKDIFCQPEKEGFLKIGSEGLSVDEIYPGRRIVVLIQWKQDKFFLLCSFPSL